MMQVNVLHQEAMNLAELAQVAKLRGEIEQSNHLLRQAFTQESSAAALIANHWESEPTRSVLHRSAASLAIECEEFEIANRLIATALSGNPPAEIAEELQDLFIQINLRQYLQRRGVALDEEQLSSLVRQ
ncbi:MAG: hypothetical protein ACK5VA_17845 [Pseudanabaena sp.]|jgi:hypothetical protein|uniref:hypothetical protein n=1 Tax=Microcystis sp. M080S2 TaxID=2771175 RepID=UPI002587ED69|nr:hypothetical protein [Microcystis sp. M080S2]MCA6502791.1 hypothetical protein [Pseudanabaena sp. M090S1SP2A07QC]MCA6507635.1 hypothetical protein [Pseudanabaena sp. M172S2SP2A07QC]MCA6519114.1 hypothetical protein [Pseudanabaena sp. M110S1SP2A07QC]MCA6520661.1 hypothetical protein [Pseudanabaena sp. M051S1SP2A07QC]MCA6526618.1 hypothetical protein [Pseudanabaena sp. M179S2SP2A07QC]MCA6529897.1 hypothetical protein [Pseudanabaena sp. M125S2SP2A07QC]MCA6532684.1 hypothetical protein [Pseud